MSILQVTPITTSNGLPINFVILRKKRLREALSKHNHGL